MSPPEFNVLHHKEKLFDRETVGNAEYVQVKWRDETLVYKRLYAFGKPSDVFELFKRQKSK